MNTCDTCKWWFRDFLTTDIQNPCANTKVTGRTSPRHDADNILWIKGTEPWENLYTGPKFGCIHHEPQ